MWKAELPNGEIITRKKRNVLVATINQRGLSVYDCRISYNGNYYTATTMELRELLYAETRL